jgi:hypothetical protein
MSNALKGILIVSAIAHLFLIVVPFINTLYASISKKSKLAWCAFLLFLPFAGAAIFHFRYRDSIFQEEDHKTKRALIEAERQKHSQYGKNNQNH